MDYKGFDINTNTTPAPWGAREQQMVQDVIDTTVGDAVGGLKDTYGHGHGKLYDANKSINLFVEEPGHVSTNNLKVSGNGVDNEPVLQVLELGVANTPSDPVAIIQAAGGGASAPTGPILHLIQDTNPYWNHGSQAGFAMNVGNKGNARCTSDFATAPIIVADSVVIDDSPTGGTELGLLWFPTQHHIAGRGTIWADTGAFADFYFFPDVACETDNIIFIAHDPSDLIGINTGDLHLRLDVPDSGHSAALILTNQSCGIIKVWYHIVASIIDTATINW
jgi:hypothetical protein